MTPVDGVPRSRRETVAIWQHRTFAVLVSLTLALVAGKGAEATEQEQGCLYSTVVDGKPVQACGYQDPLKVASDDDVLKVMRSFSIDPATVTFRGCRGGTFSTAQDASKANQYIITYPLEAADTYLAPIVHEMAHVVQMQMVGGSRAVARETFLEAN